MERCILHLVHIVGKISVLRFSVAAVASHYNHERKCTRKGGRNNGNRRLRTRVSVCRIPACLAAEVERFTASASLFYAPLTTMCRGDLSRVMVDRQSGNGRTDRTEKPPAL